MKLIDMKSGSFPGYTTPQYDVEAMRARTLANPTWIHFGAGNIFRAFHAAGLERVLNKGAYDKGVIVAESFDGEIIEKAYKPYDNLSLVVVLKSDGTIEKNVVASVADSWQADCAHEDWAKLVAAFENPSLQMVTYTVTEKGYSVAGRDGQADMQSMDAPISVIGKTALLLYKRFTACAAPIAIVSTDNCSHNGDKIKAGVMAMAEAWVEKGFVCKCFLDYLNDPKKVSFPWTMIDKITPRPDARVSEMLKESGFEDVETITTEKHSFTAPFVNAEETEYLIMEDAFPNGRPPLEEAGFIFTDRETVDKVERMKVCTCLNPLHTAMSVFGCMLGYTSICGETKDEDIMKFIKTIGYVEGMPVVVDPGIIKPTEFIDTVVNVRLPNPFMPDTPQRIATDTSQKLSIRFGETIKAYIARDDLDVHSLKCIPLVLAGWIRYAMGVDDNGNTFERSPDPMLAEVDPIISFLKLGETDFDAEGLRPLYENETLFGINLYKADIADTVTAYLRRLVAGPGAVRKTLHETVNAK